MHPDPAGDALEEVLRDLSYPALRTDAATELHDEHVVVGDHRVDIGALVDETDADVFQAPEELLAAVQDVLGDESTE